MEEEFFFPQNVSTDYSLWGLSPLHLRRLVLGLPPLLLLLSLLRTLPLLLVIALTVGVAALFAVVWCVPMFPDGLTLLDRLWAVHQHSRRPAVFPYAKEGVQARDARFSAVSRYGGGHTQADAVSDGPGLADKPSH